MTIVVMGSFASWFLLTHMSIPEAIAYLLVGYIVEARDILRKHIGSNN